MEEAYIAKWFKAKWATVTNIATIVPGELYYGRKSGTGTVYARFTITTLKVEHISDGARHVTYSIYVEVYSRNTSETDKLAISTTLDIQTSATSSLLAVVVASTGGAISSGGGAPGGTLIYGYRKAPSATDTLQTDEERQSGRDIHVIKWACDLRVQWPT